MKAFWALTKAYMIQTFRSKASLFWTYVFPVFFFFGFSIIFARGTANGVRFLLPGLLTITMVSAAFFGITMSMVMRRENGIFRRYRVTPLPASALVGANAMVAVFNMFTSILLQILLARLVYNVEIAGSLIDLGVVMIVGVLAFVPLGLIVGSVAQDMKTAPVITNLLFFPLMFLSGAALPFFMLPGWVQKLAGLMPSTYLNESLQGVIVRGESLLQLGEPLTVLVVAGIAGFLINSYLFRWESSEPIDWQKVGFSALGLFAIYGVATAMGPEFRMKERPQRNADVAKTTAIRDVTIYDGLGNRYENAVLIVDNEKIKGVQTASEFDSSRHDSIISYAGKYVIPGLIDSHMHLGGSPGGNADFQEYTPERQKHDLQAYLGLGITGIVSLTDDSEQMKLLREQVDSGAMRAPRTFFAGASITAVGGHPAARFASMPGLAEKMTRQVTSTDEARAAVSELDALGVDLIKLVLEGGGKGQPELPKLTREAFLVAVTEAKARNLVTTVHVGDDADARLAAEAGVDGLEHIPANLTAETIALLQERDVAISPTLAVIAGMRSAFAGEAAGDPLITRWVPEVTLSSLQSEQSWLTQMRGNKTLQATMRQWRVSSEQAVKRVIAGGVQVIAGSDAGNTGTFHGPGLLQELRLLASAGLPLEEVLFSATRHAAEKLRQPKLGRLQEGSYPDFVVLNADPLQSADAYGDIFAVWFRGEKLDRDALLSTDPGPWPNP